MNIRALMSELAYKNCSVAKLADLLGISKTSVYRKLSGKTEFTCSEIEIMKNTLNISGEKLLKIFFISA